MQPLEQSQKRKMYENPLAVTGVFFSVVMYKLSVAGSRFPKKLGVGMGRPCE